MSEMSAYGLKAVGASQAEHGSVELVECHVGILIRMCDASRDAESIRGLVCKFRAELPPVVRSLSEFAAERRMGGSSSKRIFPSIDDDMGKREKRACVVHRLTVGCIISSAVGGEDQRAAWIDAPSYIRSGNRKVILIYIAACVVDLAEATVDAPRDFRRYFPAEPKCNLGLATFHRRADTGWCGATFAAADVMLNLRHWVSLLCQAYKRL